MSELFGTRGVPDTVEHWDALAERVAREAARRSDASRACSVGSLAATRAALIAASLALAASLAVLAMTSRERPMTADVELGQALAPRDDVGRAIVLTGKPPAVGALLFDQARGSGQP